MDDLISRQNAIDVLRIEEELLRRVLDDMDVVGQDREKYSWGLGLIESYISDIEELPSAETVRHAKLLNAHPYGECSNCGYLIDIREEFNYCPACGARMDEE